MKEVYGDLWQEPADVRAITTNAVVKENGQAVMGKGIALQARKRYPGVDQKLGQLLKDKGNHVHLLALDLVSFPVKDDWRAPAQLSLIKRSAEELVTLAGTHGWEKIVIPRPGCGAGQLTWAEVRPLLAPILDDRFWIIEL